MRNKEFRDPAASRSLVEAIRRLASGLDTVKIMEVCGTHTMEIGRNGIRQLLPRNVELISGPGCPVCVTPAGYIDALCDLAEKRTSAIATFGDLFRVPGTRCSLAHVKAAGGTVDIVTSPLAALETARNNPHCQVVFSAVGFETTAPATASALKTAFKEKLTNISFLTAHRTVPPALLALIAEESLGISGFLLPGHVSAIIGEAAYRPVIAKGIPGAIAGFEPVDILAGIAAVLECLVNKSPAIRNEYTRVARAQGNPAARALIDECYKPADALWRGIGVIPESGLTIRPEFSVFDAALKFGITINNTEMPAGCSCGDVLKGRIRPDACPLFGAACDPDHPLGPCMVSSEGSCSAYFKYGW